MVSFGQIAQFFYKSISINFCLYEDLEKKILIKIKGFLQELKNLRRRICLFDYSLTSLIRTTREFQESCPD